MRGQYRRPNAPTFDVMCGLRSDPKRSGAWMVMIGRDLKKPLVHHTMTIPSDLRILVELRSDGMVMVEEVQRLNCQMAL